MTDILTALGDPVVRGWYLVFCFGVLVLPMIALAIWYHTNIHKSPGGRELMRRQNANPVRTRGSPGMAIRQLQEAARMATDISAGRYGAHARTMQNRVYWAAGLWITANVIAFGLLIWADEVNRVVE